MQIRYSSLPLLSLLSLVLQAGSIQPVGPVERIRRVPVENQEPIGSGQPSGSGMPEGLGKRQIVGADNGRRVIPFVTSRPIKITEGEIEVFNDLNPTAPADRFKTGYVHVHFPKEIHKRGQVERKGEDKARFQLLDLRLENRDLFTKGAIGIKEPQILVYVHGFNNDFHDSVFQTAQLTEDLGFAKGKDVTVVAYSWVSGGTLINYLTDRNFLNVEGQRLYEYLSLLIKNRPDAKVSVLAHSMGNEVTLRALNHLYEEHQAKPQVLKTIILAAPDVGVETFTSYMPRVTTLAKKVTHYFSSKDFPISISPYFNQFRERAGGQAIYHPKLDSIDVDEVNARDIGHGHSYFAATDDVLDDINNIVFSLFGEVFTPEMRLEHKWQKVTTNKGTHWKMLRR